MIELQILCTISVDSDRRVMWKYLTESKSLFDKRNFASFAAGFRIFM